jgi:hypothetical protein
MDDSSVHEAPFSRTQIYEGAVLSTIAHAIWVLAHPLLAGEEGWDGPNYYLTDGSGDYGAITFSEQITVAAFYDVHSTRSPHRDDGDGSYHPRRYFSAASPEVWQLAQAEALEYLQFEFAESGLPLVTAAFWSEGERIVSGEGWSEVVAHGGHLIERHLLPIEEAILAWQANYGFADEQVRVIRDVYQRKLARLGAVTRLTRDEERIVLSYGDAGKDAGVAILAAIGIGLPE